MMRKVKVLFFAADPRLGRPDGVPLELADEMREIEEQVKKARYGNRLKFELHGAARADDLLDFLEHTDARVVHFSGHGGRRGLVLVARDGHSVHPVDAAALKRVFHEYHGPVRLVVLSTCSSKDEAQAIADIVGCAIGTISDISDAAATTFNSRFYRAIANGHSVLRAFEHARTALQVYRIPREEYPELFVGKRAKPAKLFLVPRFRRHKQVASASIVMLLAAMVIASWPTKPPPPPISLRGIQLGDCASSTAVPLPMSAPVPAEGAATSGASSRAAADLAEAKALCAAGNYEAAFPLFRSAAQAGNPEAMGFLGIAHLTGEGTHPEPELGVELLRDGAQKGDLRSITTLATAYQNGYGVKQQSRWAKYWLRKAATEMGDEEAMRRLGVFYRDERNDSALIWLPKAIDSGSMDARVDLAIMYHHGRMVPIDTVQALDLYRTAAGAGSTRALFAMGEAYKTGFGVLPSYDSAIAYYLRAACEGSGDAMNALGVQYQNGLGVPKDPAEATRWFRLADAAGSEVAAGNLQALKTPDRPRRWRGPVARVLKWLGRAESQPQLSCATAVTPQPVPRTSGR